jgi:hypothetical protein
MKTYKVWDRVSPINGKEASYFLNSTPFKNCTHDIILISNDEGRVVQIECKEILAKAYGIDVNLDIDTFMTQYFAILEELEQQQAQEV